MLAAAFAPTGFIGSDSEKLPEISWHEKPLDACPFQGLLGNDFAGGSLGTTYCLSPPHPSHPPNIQGLLWKYLQFGVGDAPCWYERVFILFSPLWEPGGGLSVCSALDVSFPSNTTTSPTPASVQLERRFIFEGGACFFLGIGCAYR